MAESTPDRVTVRLDDGREEERVVIRFTAFYSPYNVGDIAGFEPERAQQFLAAGYAIPYDGNPTKKAPDLRVPAEISNKAILEAPAKRTFFEKGK